jgi:Holliday junction DNA helicase RuvA
MIGRLTGRVIEEDDGTTVLDVNGVGYELVTPLGTIGRARADDDGKVTLFVHTHVREDQLSLFGFASEGDRVAFRTLIGVSSVGPKTAIAVLSALPARELGLAIARKELGKLTAIAGIGKKTAERLLLELKDKLTVLSAAPPRPEAPGALVAAPPSSNGELLGRALVNMGYKAAEAERAVELLGEKIIELPLPDLLREALAVLSK